MLHKSHNKNRELSDLKVVSSILTLGTTILFTVLTEAQIS